MSTNSKPRPKPWEANQPLHDSSALADDVSMTKRTKSIDETSSGQNISLEVPPRPTSLNSDPINEINNNAYRNPHFGSNLYGNTMSGSGPYGAGSMFSGGYGSMYGGYGSMYGGGYGSLLGNGYGGGYLNPGAPGGGATGFGESTQATFQLIESLIGAVAGFAQMLESTYMATHNSFFSMISVAEQFSYLKEVLGSFFGIFAMMKFLRRILHYVTRGRLGIAPKYSHDKNKAGKDSDGSLLIEEFEKFNSNGNSESKKRKKLSWKPLILFLAAVFGFPYILNKFIYTVQNSQNARTGRITSQQVDPSKLEFARALYDFTPENPQIEATLKKGDLMAIISKQDPAGQDSEWWKVRTKQGITGYVPYNYIEIIKRQKKIEDVSE
ncbi:hypothetical protein HG535_0B04560 [Zygotorulaspora mrakii]|uniref:Peroxisomal membrane protein PEX13 n=1 Tax=Zygotorulaspora mrakii TaxID=42260 RepID=A0A7H9AZ46_ZYGMR|nr:uncharacterized protein HG535_0B04560 [Zygotorulaspora mrakii]QLG71414.1 hypothetical protein HG535_0B04560 [Zygotorulaspora mrakii]